MRNTEFVLLNCQDCESVKSFKVEYCVNFLGKAMEEMAASILNLKVMKTGGNKIPKYVKNLMKVKSKLSKRILKMNCWRTLLN